MKLAFTEDRRNYELVKHPAHMAAVNQGTMTAEQLAEQNWYLRIGNTRVSLQTANDTLATKNARVELRQRAAGGSQFAAYEAAVRKRHTATLADLAARYLARPDPDTRAETTRKEEARNLATALKWWGSKTPAGIQVKDLHAYGDHRAAAPRAAELELRALCNAFNWLTKRGHADRNPFAQLPSFRREISHTPDRMPPSDELLHTLLRRMFASTPHDQVYAAHFAFQCLTGLRPGEPGALRWDAQRPDPGARFTPPAPVGPVPTPGAPLARLCVKRLKSGINPAVTIHPALEEFLQIWRAHHAAHWPDSPYYFPHPDHPLQPLVPHGRSNTSHLGARLAHFAAQLSATLNPPSSLHITPHGARAYYVRVRRSQGAEDGTIATELGERTGATMITTTYGDPADCFADARFDWLPEGSQPAWHDLRPATGQQPNIIAL